MYYKGRLILIVKSVFQSGQTTLLKPQQEKGQQGKQPVKMFGLSGLYMRGIYGISETLLLYYHILCKN